MIYYQNPLDFFFYIFFISLFTLYTFCIFLKFGLFFIYFTLSLLPLTLTLDCYAVFKFDWVDFDRGWILNVSPKSTSYVLNPKTLIFH